MTKLRHLLWNSARLLVALAIGGDIAAAQPAPQNPPAALSSTAERLYDAARPRLLQIRTLLAAAGRQSSIGSGFLVAADGLAITNYHVVSQYALEPKTYRLEYTATDGSQGGLRLVAIDLANDLALIRLDRQGQPFFEFDGRSLSDSLPKGERLYAMGNPLDLGFTIVEGTYNGPVERSYNPRIHFSGAINPGMSGGPAVTADGRIVGVNVSKRLDGELVSFLVPARFAAALLGRAQESGLAPPADFRAEIGRQLTLRQESLYDSFGAQGFRASRFGGYEAPESAAPWFTCWAQTNADQVPPPRATVDRTSCSSDTRLFIASDLTTGLIYLTHSYVRSVDLNAFQFAAFLSQQGQASPLDGAARKWSTPQRCHEDFIVAEAAGGHPPLRAVWCARAYRAFEGLYDVWAMAVTQDKSGEALVSQLALQAVSYDNGVALTKRFLEGVQWTK